MSKKMSVHILEELVLPDRYERLTQHLGTQVANLLVNPARSNIDALSALADDVRSRNEGILVPLAGTTGIGKTTFAMNASQWLPSEYGPTCPYDGALTFDGLVSAVNDFAKTLPADNLRIIPINIDHRENAPPTDAELSALKRFLRTKAGNVHSVVFWPETNTEVATSLARRYTDIAGSTSIDLPLFCEGPAKNTWRDIAKHTLSLSNRVNYLEELGVNPDDYEPENFHTLGAFLRKISQDFTARVRALKTDLEKKVSVVIAYTSESTDPGVLTQLTVSSRYGLLDAHALVSVTSGSEIGKWWAERRGLLTRTIVQLNAHAVCLAPTAAASCIRNYSDPVPVFDKVAYKRYGPARAVRDLKRSDLGKIVCGEALARYESRGTPADDAGAAFKALAEEGFNLGKDKNLNNIMKCALEGALNDSDISFENVASEKKLPFCNLIPDNAIFFSDRVLCVEYTWRKGAFLDSSKRSTVAQYALRKLQTYARQLGWTSD